MNSKRTSSLGGLSALIVLSLICVGVLFFADKAAAPLSEEKTVPVVNDDVSTSSELLNDDIDASVIVLRRDKGKTSVIRIRSDKQESLLYTDVDESRKLQRVLGVKDDGSAMYALTATDAAETDIVKILLDGSGEESVIRSQFPLTTTPPAIAAKTDRIAYVIFNNAERNFGFTLVHEELTGDSSKTLATDKDSIGSLAWSPDNTQIAFAKGFNTGMSLMTATIDGKEKERLSLPAGKTILEITWLDDKTILLCTTADAGKSRDSIIEKLSLDDGQLSQIIDTPGRETTLVTRSNIVAFLANTESSEELPSGTVTLIDIATGKQVQRGTANQVVFIQK